MTGIFPSATTLAMVRRTAVTISAGPGHRRRGGRVWIPAGRSPSQVPRRKSSMLARLRDRPRSPPRARLVCRCQVIGYRNDDKFRLFVQRIHTVDTAVIHQPIPEKQERALTRQAFLVTFFPYVMRWRRSLPARFDVGGFSIPFISRRRSRIVLFRRLIVRVRRNRSTMPMKPQRSPGQKGDEDQHVGREPPFEVIVVAEPDRRYSLVKTL